MPPKALKMGYIEKTITFLDFKETPFYFFLRSKNNVRLPVVDKANPPPFNLWYKEISFELPTESYHVPSFLDLISLQLNVCMKKSYCAALMPAAKIKRGDTPHSENFLFAFIKVKCKQRVIGAAKKPPSRERRFLLLLPYLLTSYSIIFLARL